jgi:hypothetical protein
MKTTCQFKRAYQIEREISNWNVWKQPLTVKCDTSSNEGTTAEVNEAQEGQEVGVDGAPRQQPELVALLPRCSEGLCLVQNVSFVIEIDVSRRQRQCQQKRSLDQTPFQQPRPA